jgi:hypothetical protein
MTLQPSTIEADVERWYREHFEQPIAGKQAFVDAISAAYAPPMRYLDLEDELLLSDLPCQPAMAPCSRPCECGFIRSLATAARPGYDTPSAPIGLGRGYLWGHF